MCSAFAIGAWKAKPPLLLWALVFGHTPQPETLQGLKTQTQGFTGSLEGARGNQDGLRSHCTGQCVRLFGED